MAHTETWNGSTDAFTNPADWSPDNVVPGLGDTAIVNSGTIQITGFINGVTGEIGDTSGQGLLPTLAAVDATFGSSMSISDIAGGGTSQITVDGTLTNDATVLVTNFGSQLAINNAAGTSSTFDQAAGSITVLYGEVDLNTATVKLDASIAVSDGGLLSVNAPNPNQTGVAMSGTGLVELAADSEFSDAAATTSGITVQFDDATNDILALYGAFTGNVTGFDANNTIDFYNVTTADAATWSNGVLTLTSNGSAVETINLTGTAVTANTQFTVIAQGTGGVSVTIAPAYVTGVTASVGSVALKAGASLTVTVALSTSLQVDTTGGVPTLTLNEGGTATYDAANSTSTSLVFDYTVGSGENTGALAVTAFNLNGATIQDNGGANADVSGAVTTLAGPVEIAATAPGVATTALTVAGGANATPIGIVAPTDSVFSASQLTATITALPNDGRVFLANGTTQVTAGQTLTIAQLTSLVFSANSYSTNPASTLAYTITDPAGNTAAGTATLTVATAETWNGATAPFGTAADWSLGVVPGMGDTAIIPAGTVSMTGTSNGVAFELGDTSGQGLLPTLAATSLTLDGFTSISDIAGGGTSQITVSGTLTDNGAILVTNFGSQLAINNVTATANTFDQAAGSITVAAGEVDLNTAAVILNAGVSVTDNGLLAVNNFNPNQTAVALSGTGTVDLAAGSQFEDLAASTAGITVQFDDATNNVFTLGGSFTGAVTGFDANNVIDFTTIPAADAASWSNGVLTLTKSGATVGSINLTGPAVNANTRFAVSADNSGGVQVSIAPAYVTGVTASLAAAGAGTTIVLTVGLSTALQVNTLAGTPTLTLNDGGTATYDAVNSTSTALLFDYPVAAGDNTPDLSVTAFNLNGATIQDNGGANANLTAAITTLAGPVQIETAPASPATTALTVAGGANATPIGIVAPTDSVFSASQLTATITALPNDGHVHLADGSTGVSVGQTLTIAQLTGLTFTPSANTANPASTLAYTVTDPVGNTAAGTATLTVATSETWNGATAPFGTAADWSAGVVPLIGDTAIIPSGTVTLTGTSNGIAFELGDTTGQGLLPTLAATNLTLGGFTSISDIAGGGTSQITVSGTLTDNGAILVTNFGSQLAINNVTATANTFDQAAGSITVAAGEVDLNTAAVILNAGVSVTDNGLLAVDNFNPNQTAVALSGTGTVDLAAGSQFEDLATSTTGLTVQFDDTTNDIFTLGGGFTGGTFQGSVTGFDTNNVIDFANISAVTSAYYDGTDLVLADNGATVAKVALTGPSITTRSTFTLTSDLGNGTNVSLAAVPCYCRGTLILTDRGDVPVESLQVGDRLVTVTGAVRPIVWIGRRSYLGRFAAGNRKVLPVTIRAGALGDGMPHRDLSISPLHAMYLDGLLVPAAALVNGTTIVQASHVDRVDYFHVELETHDVVLAEGAPSETFVNDDGRAMFHNASEYDALYPDAADSPARYYAPRAEDGFAVERIRARLAVKAA